MTSDLQSLDVRTVVVRPWTEACNAVGAIRVPRASFWALRGSVAAVQQCQKPASCARAHCLYSDSLPRPLVGGPSLADTSFPERRCDLASTNYWDIIPAALHSSTSLTLGFGE
jgi:hypothetical protein